jgi:hypothetical protein
MNKGDGTAARLFVFVGSLCIGAGAGLAASLIKGATFERYIVAILVSVGVWILIVGILEFYPPPTD